MDFDFRRLILWLVLFLAALCLLQIFLFGLFFSWWTDPFVFCFLFFLIFFFFFLPSIKRKRWNTPFSLASHWFLWLLTPPPQPFPFWWWMWRRLKAWMIDAPRKHSSGCKYSRRRSQNALLGTFLCPVLQMMHNSSLADPLGNSFVSSCFSR